MGGLAVHDGIFKSNFTAGKRRENDNSAFGKVAVGNDFLGGDGLFRDLCPSNATVKQAGSETDVSGYTQAALSRQLEVPFNGDNASKLH